jgi:tripartite-type tricarboxylate transporter receptor subunit TctC
MTIDRYRTIFALSLCASVLALLPAGRTHAQDYPARPITFVVGFAAGGFADGAARILGNELSKRLGQNVIVENRGGAGGNIAAAAVAKAAPDGYTVLISTSGLAINSTLTKKSLGFAVDDLRAVAVPAWAPETLSVHSQSPIKTLAELVTSAKTKPINFGSPGVGTSGHIASTYFFKALAKVEAVHVPFRGGAPAVNAAAGGHIDALSGAVAGYGAQFQAKIIRGLAVASEKRMTMFPDIPTYAEQGYPQVIAATWIGVFLPAKTDDAIAEKLNKTINDIVGDAEAQAQFKKLLAEVRRDDLAHSSAYFKSEIDRWGKMIDTIGLTLD